MRACSVLFFTSFGRVADSLLNSCYCNILHVTFVTCCGFSEIRFHSHFPTPVARYQEEVNHKQQQEPQESKFQKLFTQSLYHLETGVKAFSAVNDEPNLALLYSNTGRLMRMCAHFHSPDASDRHSELAGQERHFYNKVSICVLRKMCFRVDFCPCRVCAHHAVQECSDLIIAVWSVLKGDSYYGGKESNFIFRGQLKCDGTRTETMFRLSAKRTSPLKSAGVSVQSTTGSRVRISDSNAGYTMFRGNVKGTGYPLHLPVSPSFPLLCVTMCHHVWTGVYLCLRP